MINRIITILFMPALLFALFLSLAGVRTLPFDTTLYSFFAVVGERFNNFVIQIPNIPKIPKIDYADNGGGWQFVLNALIFIANLIVTLFNSLVTMLNVVVLVLNILIALIEYICIFIYSAKDLKEILLRSQQQAQFLFLRVL